MRLSGDFIRFGLVSVLGLCVDLAVAWSLASLLPVPLPIAALGGFLAGAALNYGLHEVWTFASRDRRPSVGRGGLYLLALGITLGVRVASVAALETFVFPAPEQALAALVMATGLSFVVNYLLSKYVVFRSPSAAAPTE
ncbi:MAG: GtrA family protein [Caulobacter sp.]|nr:GtrA family protein [Caulobacter sp.]